MDEKRNFVPCPKDAGMLRFVKVGGRAFTQADPKLIVTCVLQSYQKTETFNFHSELSLAFCDSLSACTLRTLVRYSTDITACLLTKSFQMDLLKSTLLCVILIFKRYEIAVLLSICKWSVIFVILLRIL